jgi:hypothetical protein
MSFISYAPNFEDVTLWRMLGHLDSGVYVEVDGRGPTAESIGRAFLERGWKGVHVTDDGRALACAGILHSADIVIAARIGSPSPVAATALAGAGVQEDGNRKGPAAPVLTLDALFDRIGAGAIHWMRLDLGNVEGNPFDGWHRSAVRPWVLLVSHVAAVPFDDVPPRWESQVLAKGYQLAAADPVSRYYVCADSALVGQHRSVWSGEHAASERSSTLPDTPASALELARAERALQELQFKLFDAQATIAQAEERAAKAESEALSALAEARQVAVLQRHLSDLYDSTSWRITKPMRWVSRLRRSPRSALGEIGAAAAGFARRIRSTLMHRAINFILARPSLKRVALRTARHFPGLLQRYKTDIKVVMAAAPPPGHSNHTTVIGPRFRSLILDELQRLESPSQQGKA